MIRTLALAILTLIAAGTAAGQATTRGRTVLGTACLHDEAGEHCIEKIKVTAVQEFNKWVLRPVRTGSAGDFKFDQVAVDTYVRLIARHTLGDRYYFGETVTEHQVRLDSDYRVDRIKVELKTDRSRVALLEVPRPDWRKYWTEDSSGVPEPELATTVPLRFESGTQAVPAVEVTLISADTDDPPTVQRSSAQGQLTLALDPAKHYTAIITADGYQTETRLLEGTAAGWLLYRPGGDWERPSTLQLRRLARPGQPIQAHRPNLLTMSRAADMAPATMEALPLAPVRTVDTFALLESGVAPAPEGGGRSGPGIGPGIGTVGEFSVNGLRSRENNFTIDGADNNDEDTGVRRQAYLIPAAQSIESLQVFQLITAAPDARYGRSVGAQVNIVSKAGGAGWHGTLSGFLSDSRWNARDYFSPGGSRSPQPLTLDGRADGVPVALSLNGVRFPGLTASGNGGLLRPAETSRPAGTRSQSGLALGGPIMRGRSFGFAAVERISNHAVRDLHAAVPTAAQRGFQGSGATGLPAGLYPSTIAGNAVFSLYPFPNNPTGPYGPNTYTVRRDASGTGTLYSLKFDQLVERRLNTWLTLRINGTEEETTLPSVGGGIRSAVKPASNTQNIVAVLANNIRSSLSHNFRFSFGRSRSDFQPLVDPDAQGSTLFPGQAMLLNAPMLYNLSQNGQPRWGTVQFAGGPFAGANQTEQFIGAIGELRIAGFSPVGADSFRFPQDRNQRTYQFSDVVTHVRGRNTLQAGLDVRRLRLASRQARNARPQLEFHGLLNELPSRLALAPALSALDAAAAGAPAGMLQTFSLGNDDSLSLRRTTLDFYITDDFRVTPRLLITAGLRLEFNRLPKGLDDRLALAYTPTQFQAETAKARAACPPDPLIRTGCQGLVDNLYTNLNSELARIYGQDRIGNDPRFGLAYDLTGNQSRVLRAAFGVYTGQFPVAVINESRSTFPSYAALNVARAATQGPGRVLLYNLASPLSESFRQPGTLGTLQPNNAQIPNLMALLGNFVLSNVDPVTNQAVVGTDAILGRTEPAAGIKNPYAYQFHLTLDQRLTNTASLSVGYVGTAGHRLLRIATPNGGVFRRAFNAQATYQLAAGFPDVVGLMAATTTRSGEIPLRPTQFEGTANSSYHSLQSDFSWRPRRGPQVRTVLTWSHSIDDASDFFETAGAPALAQNSSRRSERGPSGFDTRVRSVSHWVWSFRSGRNRWLTGYEWSGIFTLQSGQPFTVNTTYDWNRDGNLTDRLNTVSGIQSGPDRRQRLTLAPGTNMQTLLAPAGQDGSVGRNTFRGTGLANLDAAWGATLLDTERLRVRIRSEGFNLCNRTSFGLPVRWLEAPGFGSSTSTIQPNRVLQFALKLDF